MTIEQTKSPEYLERPLSFRVQNIIRNTPRSHALESEDRAEVVDCGDVINLLVADGATGVGALKIDGHAPGWFAAEYVAQAFHGDTRSPREFIFEANRGLRGKLSTLVEQGQATPQELTDLCSAVCVAARIEKKTGILRFAATKADCWLLVLHADGSIEWLTDYPQADMDYGIIKTAYDLQKVGAITAMKGSLNHPDVSAAVLRGRKDANDPSGTGNGRINGAPDADLEKYIEDNEIDPFVLQPGDRLFLGTDGLLPLMSRAIYEMDDPTTAAHQGREEQRRFVEDALRVGGADELLRRVLYRESVEDPDGILYPHIKDKTGDDKALIEIHVSDTSSTSSVAPLRNDIQTSIADTFG